MSADKEDKLCQTEQRLLSVTLKLLRRMDMALDDDARIDLKDYKSLSSALKELRDLQETLSPAGAEGLTVCFSNETQSASR